MKHWMLCVSLAGLSMAMTDIAQAACTGTNGRGWGRGQGSGQFTMTQADKTCRIGNVNVINEATGVNTPATQITVTRKPANGTMEVVAGRGFLYRPNPGFVGTDRYCIRAIAPKVPNVPLSGCVSITVK